MTQRVIFMKDEDVEGILNRIVESINEEDLIVESFRDSWEVYKNETFLGKNYGKKRYLVIKKDVVDEYLLMEKLRTELLAMEEDMYVFSGVSEEISFSDLNNFYIDGNNLVLVFSKYEIAPGTAGIIRIEFDISTVKPDNKQTIIDFSSHPDALKFKTNLIEGVKGGPNFAEHYTIISWGCGTMCQVVAIVDNRDGAVYFPITSTLGIDFRIDSNLLIVDPSWKIQENFGEYEIPDWAHPRYYIWENNSLIEI
jgi:hypothetical protein